MEAVGGRGGGRESRASLNSTEDLDGEVRVLRYEVRRGRPKPWMRYFFIPPCASPATKVTVPPGPQIEKKCTGVSPVPFLLPPHNSIAVPIGTQQPQSHQPEHPRSQSDSYHWAATMQHRRGRFLYGIKNETVLHFGWCGGGREVRESIRLSAPTDCRFCK